MRKKEKGKKQINQGIAGAATLKAALMARHASTES